MFTGQPFLNLLAERHIHRLNGVELRNLWFTLDNCAFLYFDETLQPHPKSQINAIDYGTHF
jgi:hypothetical protein